MFDLDAQRALEASMVDRGMQRARLAFDRAFSRNVVSETGPGQEALKRVLNPVADAVAHWLVTHEAMGGARPALLTLAGHLDPFVLAYLALRTAIDLGSQGENMTFVAATIGRAVEDELRLDAFAKANPGLLKSIERTMADRGASPEYARAFWSKSAKEHDIEIPRWAQRQRILVGMALLDIVTTNTDFFAPAQVGTGKNKFVWKFQTTPAFQAWLIDRIGKEGLLKPAFLPMVVPPVPWSSLRGGGYISPAVNALPLVKRSYRQQHEELKAADLSRVYATVNAAQDTAWRVNEQVLGVMQRAWDSGAKLDCLPAREDEKLPPKPWAADPTPEQLSAWSADARSVYERNAKSRGVRFDLSRLLTTATDLREAPALYFPHQLDFRSRLYAVPQALQPQGSDLAKSLLTFAEADYLSSSTAMEWLFVHGANVFGNDKVSLEDRANWGHAQVERAFATAADPFRDLWWTEADKPWQFLAWCYDATRAFNGDGKSSIPVALDGSCNGLQHYSAMLRDPVGGAAVNLLPSVLPQDIYQRVADRVLEMLHELSREGDWVARGWIDFGIDRKITKRPVMVLPYGGTRMSCMEYTRAAVREKLAAGAENPFGDTLMQAETKLAGLIWQAIGDVVVAARAAMDWLQRVARVCSKADLPLSWETPSGFIGYQDYRDKDRRLVKTRLRGSVVRLVYYDERDTISASRQALGFPPNFVHSLDASALSATVNSAKSSGINSFAVIHDSFGTTASKTEQLSQVIRQAFVDLYEAHDPLQELWLRTKNRLPSGTDLPPPPAKGDLDIREVLNSRYFFA